MALSMKIEMKQLSLPAHYRKQLQQKCEPSLRPDYIEEYVSMATAIAAKLNREYPLEKATLTAKAKVTLMKGLKAKLEFEQAWFDPVEFEELVNWTQEDFSYGLGMATLGEADPVKIKAYFDPICDMLGFERKT